MDFQMLHTDGIWWICFVLCLVISSSSNSPLSRSWISGSFVLEDLILDEEVVVSDLDYESCEGLQVIAWMVWTWPDIDRPGSFIMIWSLLICLRLVFRHQPGQQSQDGLLIMPPKIYWCWFFFENSMLYWGNPMIAWKTWQVIRWQSSNQKSWSARTSKGGVKICLF